MSEGDSKEKKTPKKIAKTKCKDIKNTVEKKYCFEKTKSRMEGELARKQLKQLTSEEKAKNEGSLVNEGNDYDVIYNNKDNFEYKNDPVNEDDLDEQDDEDLQEGGKRKRRSKKSKKSKKKRSTRKKGKKSRRKTIRRHGRRH